MDTWGNASSLEGVLRAHLKWRVRLGPGFPDRNLSRESSDGPQHLTGADDQGDEADEVWQGIRYIPDHSLGWRRGPADPRPNSRYHPLKADPYWPKGDHHCLPLQGRGVAFEWGNYQSLKLLDKVMKVLDWEEKASFDNRYTSMTCISASCLDASLPTPFSLCTS